jgi:hypothetical protein
LKEALEQEHEASSLTDFLDITNNMAAQDECNQLAAEGNGGRETRECREKNLRKQRKWPRKSNNYSWNAPCHY